MEFFSPIEDIFISKELNSALKEAKHRQITYSLDVIKDFSFFDDEDEMEIRRNNANRGDLKRDNTMGAASKNKNSQNNNSKRAKTA